MLVLQDRDGEPARRKEREAEGREGGTERGKEGENRRKLKWMRNTNEVDIRRVINEVKEVRIEER